MQKSLNKFWKNKNVLITGHTGFKGSWLTCVLLELGANIIGYSLKPEKNSIFKLLGLEKRLKKNYYQNINSYEDLDKAIKINKPQIIFHLAAQPLVNRSYLDPRNTFIDNALGTLNLLDMIKKYNHIKSSVIITTDKVYFNNNDKIKFKENNSLWGKDPYSSSKVCAEQIVSSYKYSFNKSGGIRFTSVARSGNVIGGLDHNLSRIIPDIFYSYKKKKKLTIRMPNAVRPWQHVLEPTFGYLILAQKQYSNFRFLNNGGWNFGPENKNFKTVFEIFEFFKKKLKIRHEIKKSKFKESKILMLDNQKAKKILGWKSKWNIKKTLEKILELEMAKKKDIKKVVTNQIKDYLK